MFSLSRLRFLCELLPLLGHFAKKRSEARISSRAGLLKAQRCKSLILSWTLHFSESKTKGLWREGLSEVLSPAP